MNKIIVPILLALCFLSAMPVYAADPGATASEADSQIIRLEPPATAASDSGSIYQVQDADGSKPDNKLHPTQIQTVQENGYVLIQKTFEVEPNVTPEQLVDTPFEQDGYRFQMQDILMQQLPGTTEARLAYQTVSMPSEDKDEKKVMKLLAPVIDHEQDGFAGQLRLDASTLIVEADGYAYYQYTVTKTKEFNALDRNDPVYMEKSTDQNGVPMKLMDVDWSAQTQTQVADSLVPTLYRGDAIYQGVATGKKATGYTATVSYIGELTKTTPGNIQYTVIYRGSEIPQEKKPVNPVPIAAAATTTTGGIFYAVFFFFFKKNAKIYNMQDDRSPAGSEPVLIDKQRVKVQNPVIDLSGLKHKSMSNAYRIALDKMLSGKLAGKTVNILTSDKTLQHKVTGSGGIYEFDVYA